MHVLPTQCGSRLKSCQYNAPPQPAKVFYIPGFLTFDPEITNLPLKCHQFDSNSSRLWTLFLRLDLKTSSAIGVYNNCLRLNQRPSSIVLKRSIITKFQPFAQKPSYHTKRFTTLHWALSGRFTFPKNAHSLIGPLANLSTNRPNHWWAERLLSNLISP